MINQNRGNKVLIVAATAKELGPMVEEGNLEFGKLISLKGHTNAQALVTGVGVLPTAYYLGKVLTGSDYKIILNIGLCGAYEAPPEPGEVVLIVEDRLYGLGAEGVDGFLSLREIGLAKSGEPEDGFFITPAEDIPQSAMYLRKVKGITVNTIHAWPSSIQSALAVTGARVESMEGAACMYVAAKEGIPIIQVRAVSNMVGPRDLAAWMINESIEALHQVVKKILKELR